MGGRKSLSFHLFQDLKIIPLRDHRLSSDRKPLIRGFRPGGIVNKAI